MILVDTSVRIDHFRSADIRLREPLDAGRVLARPFVIGEIAMASLARPGDVLAWMRRLPVAAEGATMRPWP